MADKIKLLLAAAIVVGSLVAFYLFPDVATVFRVLGILVAVGVAAAIAKQTAVGAGVFEFGRGALIEVRKVVWPSRKETTNTTLIVMAMVVLVGIILWIFDWILASGVQMLTGQGS